MRSINLPAMIVGALMLFGISASAFAQHPDLLRPFPYAASDEKVDLALRDLTRQTGISVITSNEVNGTITINNTDGSIMDILNSISEQVNAVWWFDGSAVRVEPSSVLTSRMIALDGINVAHLQQQLRAVRMADSKFPLVADPDASMVRVAGPAGYVDAVEALALHLAELRKAERPIGASFPLIIRGRDRVSNQTQNSQQSEAE